MVKKNELRLGNQVKHDHEGFLVIKYLSQQGVRVEDSGGMPYVFNFEDLDGIKLKPAILRQLGFEFKDEELDKRWEININNGWILQWYENGSTYYKYQDANDEISNVRYEYVHQIQNLYFILTGEELPEIKF